jgi:hypothetical protein
MRGQFFVALPFVIAVLDGFGENTLLWPAAHLVKEPPYHAPVLIALMIAAGGFFAALKWMLALVWAWGFGSEMMSGPRGAVLRRARFSVLALILGGLPLLAIPQGRDILQRLAEGERPFVRAGLSVLGVLAAGLMMWRSARALVQFKLEVDRSWADTAWGKYFAEQIPRILGVAMPGVAGAAFALQAGKLDVGLFVAAAVVGGLILLVRKERLASMGAAIIRAFRLPRRWLEIEMYPERIAAALSASILGLLIIAGYRFIRWLLAADADGDALTLAALDFAAWLCYVGGWGLYLYVYFRRERNKAKYDSSPVGGPATMNQRLDALQEYSYNILEFERGLDRRFVVPIAFAAGVSVATLVAFAFGAVAVGRFIGPLWVLSIFLMNTVFLGGVAVWVHARYHIPVVRLGVVAALICGLWNENHSVATIGSPLPRTFASYDSKTLHGHLEEWLASPNHVGRDTVPVVLVAAAGGGLRAAYWTAMALSAIQDADSTFASDLFAISGVSGGSVGGALFATIARDARLDTSHSKLQHCVDHLSGDDTTHAASSPYSACVRAFMRDDFLSPVLAKMIGPDLLQRFSPFELPRTDRSQGLEGSWEASYESVLGDGSAWKRGMLELTRDSSVRATVPALILNSTHVETGKRYIASTLLTDSTFTDVTDVIRLLDRDLPVSSAAHNSARFTYVSPPGHLDTRDGKEHGRVVDGGYFENSGLVTLRQVYESIERWKRVHPDSRPTPVSVVVYLCNDPVSCNGTARASSSPAGDTLAKHAADSLAHVSSTWANEALGPVRAVLNARDARAALGRAELRGLLGNRFIQLNVCRDSVRATLDSARAAQARDRTVSPPLGWLLSSLARHWMDASIRDTLLSGEGRCRRDNVEALKALRRRERHGATTG